MRKRRIPSKRSKIKGTIENPSFSNCSLGKYKAPDERQAAVAEYSDQRGFVIGSGYSSGTAQTWGKWINYKTSGNAMTSVAWVQAKDGSTTWTKSNSESGSQAVFCTEYGSADSLYQNAYSLFEQLPDPMSNNRRTQNFMVGTLSQETNITNSSNIYWQMTIYDYVARRDTTILTGTFDLKSPLHMWAQGLSYTQLAGADPASAQYPYSVKATPFQSQLFCQYYKVVKTHQIWLGPGATHTHVFKNNLNKVFYPLRFMVSSGNISGATFGSIYTIVGQPVESSTSGVDYPVTTGIIDGTVVTKIRGNATQKWVNKNIYNPESATNFYRATQTVGAFKALLDNSYKYESTIEGGT